MAVKYVSRARVTRNGQKIQHMKSFRRREYSYAAEVETMDGGGSVDLPKRPGFSLDYALPKTNPKLDWSDVRDEDWTVELDGGKRIIYTGVDCVSMGEVTIDGEKESVATLTFIAATEVIE